ncbi:MAG: phytanoyl-CoA dioxygenase family protein [Halioglobus sp.]|nr:phytanoyl-CoA dioxygenase family protein [Halioglobus sp.]
MSVDCRTRRYCDTQDLTRDAIFDSLLPDALSRHGELAARGLRYKQLPGLALSVGDRTLVIEPGEAGLRLSAGSSAGCVQVALEADALSDLVQDQRTTMGLAMQSRVQVTQGAFEHWIAWEPVLRALFDGRRVHEAGDIVLRDLSGAPLDVHRSFSLDDDREVVRHFLQEAGYLHVRNVFTAAEMAAVSRDLTAALARAQPDDQASWWAEDASGKQQAVRVLWFHEQSQTLQRLLHDERLQWLASLTGDSYLGDNMGAEGLVKPLHIQKGLSDLPWHKDCGQGRHSLLCNSLTVGISVTGADRDSGALGVVPGSHRANVQCAGRDESLDLAPLKLETRTGDLTVHCSDTLHRAHSPLLKPRQVVYTSLMLAPLPGDSQPEVPEHQQRDARAKLTNVQERIAGAAG